MLPNCPQYIIAAFAVLRHGAVIVNINPTYTAREVLTVANDSGIRVLIALDALAPLVLAVRAQTSIEEIVITSIAESTPAAAAPPRVEGTRSLTDRIEGVPETKGIRAAGAPGDLAVLQYWGHDRDAEGRDADPSEHLREPGSGRDVHGPVAGAASRGYCS